MKNFLIISAAALITLTPAIAHSQTVYNIGPGDVNASAYGNCSNCTFNITPGYTFTMDATYTYTNVIFNGGTVNFANDVNSNSTITLNNDTVTLNAAQTIKSMNFNNDSIAINQTLGYNTGVAEIANSRISVGANLTFQAANLIADSMHVAAAITFNGNPDSVSNSHVTLESGSSLTWQKPIISNSVFSLMANSTFTSNGAFTASNSTFYEDGTAPTPAAPAAATSLTLSSTATLTNVNFVMTNAATASVSSALSMTGSTMTMSGASKFTAYSSISLASSDVSLSGTASLSASSNINMTSNSDLTVGDGSGAASVSANTINVSGGSLLGVATNSTVTLGSGKLNGSTGTSYTVSSLHGCATFDDTKTPQTCTSLALGDMVLSAAAKGPGEVVLSWTDNPATPVNEYLVQRSTGNDLWSPIATVDANTSSTGEYTFVDADAPAGEVFYRIERVAADGTLAYSPVSTITNATGNSRSAGIFPNPAVGGRFYLTTPGTEETIVNVYTTTGQLLLHTALQGQTQYPIQLSSQPLSLSAIVVQTIYQNNTHSYTVLVR
jgi:hypothetical protein